MIIQAGVIIFVIWLVLLCLNEGIGPIHKPVSKQILKSFLAGWIAILCVGAVIGPFTGDYSSSDCIEYGTGPSSTC